MNRRLVTVLLFWFCLSLTAFAEEPKMNLSKIAQISIRAKDLQRATAFYRDTLELKIIVSTPVISIAECGSFSPYQQGRDSGVGSSQFRDLLRCGRHTEDNCGSFKPQCKN